MLKLVLPLRPLSLSKEEEEEEEGAPCRSTHSKKRVKNLSLALHLPVQWSIAMDGAFSSNSNGRPQRANLAGAQGKRNARRTAP